jgi:isopentenyl-diphosphate Delta-isomerase
LLQKRSATKRVWPNAWDISAAGHLESGQTSTEAALREAEEETGLQLSVDDLQFLFTQKHNVQRGDYYDNREYDDIFLVEREIDPKALKFPADEVAGFQLMPWRKLREKIEAKTPGFVPHGQYPKLFEIIEAKGY